MGVTDLSPFKDFDFNQILTSIGSVKETAFALFGNPGLGSLFSDGTRVFLVIITVFAFSLSDTFDTIGTFIGTGRKSGIFDEDDEKALESGKGFASRMDKALFADSIATSVGALFGTSNTTTYVESAAGIEAGGRTGLTSVVTAIAFLLTLVIAPFIGVVPAAATAPALIVVGIMMMESMGKIKWDSFVEAAPAFLTAIIMTFAYNISYGIAAGFIFYCLVKIITGKAKEVHLSFTAPPCCFETPVMAVRTVRSLKKAAAHDATLQTVENSGRSQELRYPLGLRQRGCKSSGLCGFLRRPFKRMQGRPLEPPCRPR